MPRDCKLSNALILLESVANSARIPMLLYYAQQLGSLYFENSEVSRKLGVADKTGCFSGYQTMQLNLVKNPST